MTSTRWLILLQNGGCPTIREDCLPYEVGISVVKGAGDHVSPTRGMVDLECKAGQTGKVIMRKVAICALDINVLTLYSLHEQGWETRLGTWKASSLP